MTKTKAIKLPKPFIFLTCKNILCCRENHCISCPAWLFCLQPNLATASPSAFPSAQLSAACLEVNSLMIPLSFLSIFKWLILPFWQLLVQAAAGPPSSCLASSSSGQHPVTRHVTGNGETTTKYPSGVVTDGVNPKNGEIFDRDAHLYTRDVHALQLGPHKHRIWTINLNANPSFPHPPDWPSKLASTIWFVWGAYICVSLLTVIVVAVTFQGVWAG